MEPSAAELLAAIIARGVESGLGPREISRRSGVPYATVARFLQGSTGPALTNFLAIALSLGVKVSVRSHKGLEPPV